MSSMRNMQHAQAAFQIQNTARSIFLFLDPCFLLCRFCFETSTLELTKCNFQTIQDSRTMLSSTTSTSNFNIALKMTNVPTRLNNINSFGVRILSHQKPTVLPAGYYPSEIDVVAGRGKKNWNHKGNVHFRCLIRKNVTRYIESPSKGDKTDVVVSLVEEIREKGGHFLTQDIEGKWYDVGNARAREKVGHSLRDQVTTLGKSKGGTSILEQAKEVQARQMKTPPALICSDSEAFVTTRAPSSDTVLPARVSSLSYIVSGRQSWIAEDMTIPDLTQELSREAFYNSITDLDLLIDI
jgi:hypothetical protein